MPPLTAISPPVGTYALIFYSHWGNASHWGLVQSIFCAPAGIRLRVFRKDISNI